MVFEQFEYSDTLELRMIIVSISYKKISNIQKVINDLFDWMIRYRYTGESFSSKSLVRSVFAT